MTWEYDQRSGILTHNGKFYYKGYSGHGSGVNNPSMEAVEGMGPIPRGRYRINGSHNTVTKVTIILDPISTTNTYGRSLFRIHGGSKDGSMNASNGCIIVDGITKRQEMLASGDTILVVR